MNRLLRNVILIWASAALRNPPSALANEDTGPVSITNSGTTTVKTSATSLGRTGLPSKGGNSTCPSRTVNYITHTLPQQCLRTDRAPHNSTNSSPELTVPHTGLTRVSGDIHAETEVVTGTMTSETEIAKIVTVTISAGSDSSFHDGTSLETALEVSPAEEVDSPLDNANFLSFEEWKKQNLAKTGQSPEDIGHNQNLNPNRPRPGINNALDTLGEESEIDLDFSGFGGAAPVQFPESSDGYSANELAHSSASEHESGSIVRSKDAGKTCKERTNYASFDCSATVLKSNKECKSVSSILVENKDSYLLNKCSAENKFFIVELCNDIQIDTVVLANYEFFSSSFRHFRVSVSDRYPVKMEKWRDLGTFEARNTREIQAFLVKNPLIWAKYLRIEFLSHYGTEYYCPVSLLRVHGTTMIEDYRHQEDLARGEEEDIVLEPESSVTDPVPLQSRESIIEDPKDTMQALSSDGVSNSQLAVPDPQLPITASQLAPPADNQSSSSQTVADTSTLAEAGVVEQNGVYEPSNLNITCETTTANPDQQNASLSLSHEMASKRVQSAANCEQSSNVTESSRSSGSSDTSAVVSEIPSPTATISPLPVAHHTTFVNYTQSSAKNSTATNITEVVTNAPINSVNSSISVSQSTTGTNSSRTVNATPVGPQAPQPSTQESFFKSFAKRLQQLESNSTLSLQYIEEQSRILRDAFSKVEKRQVLTTTKFLSQLNETVMAELHDFRQAYDQLWQSTVIELEGHRETYQREMLALSSRLTMVADELVWQKRMGIVQSTLLLLCLALVVFGRSGNGYLEMPIMQQMMNKSTAAIRAGWESPPHSPSPDSRSPVSFFRRKLIRSGMEHSGETSLTDSEQSRPQSAEGPPGVVFVEPPSPPDTYDAQSDYDDGEQTTEERKSSPEVENKEDEGASPALVSQKRNDKRPHDWARSNGYGHGSGARAKSPLAL